MHRFKAEKIPAVRRGGRHTVPSITKKLIPIYTFWERGRPLFFSGVSESVSTAFQGRFYVYKYLANTV